MWRNHCSSTVTGATIGPPVNGGQRRSPLTSGQPPSDHRSTTAGPPVNHRRTTGQRWLTASQRSGQMVATAATWHATSAADVAEGIITLLHRIKLMTSWV
ncbi:hypothetical protein Tco_0150567 [Tanacetum coccineum]